MRGQEGQGEDKEEEEEENKEEQDKEEEDMQDEEAKAEAEHNAEEGYCYDLSLSHNGLLFHFNVVYSAMHSLHHFLISLSFSSVIVHCTIHVFQIL